MKSIYIIEYDNGESYEDHSRWPVLAVATKKQADQIIAEVTAWVDKQRVKLPEVPEMPQSVGPSGEFSDGEWEKRWQAHYDGREARKAAIEKLRAPHGLNDMKAALYDDRSGMYSRLVITKIPFVAAKIPLSE